MQRQQAQTDFDMAKKALANIKGAVLALNDIIPDVQIPSIYAEFDYVHQYINQFGMDKMKKYTEAHALLDTVRAYGIELLRGKYTGIPNPKTTLLIAHTFAGMGLCSELSNRILLELYKVGYKKTASLIAIQGTEMRGNGGCYDHAFVILDACDQLSPGDKIEKFRLLNDHALFVDPLLNVVGQANQLEKHIAGYIDHFKLNHIDAVVTADLSTVNWDLIVRNATNMANDIKKMIGPCMETKNVAQNGNVSSIFTELTPLERCIESIKLQCNKLEIEKSVADALAAKYYALAFRIVCARGNADIIYTFIKNWELLGKFNVSEPSPTKGLNASDWLQKNVLIRSDLEKMFLVVAIDITRKKALAEIAPSVPSMSHRR